MTNKDKKRESLKRKRLATKRLDEKIKANAAENNEVSNEIKMTHPYETKFLDMFSINKDKEDEKMSILLKTVLKVAFSCIEKNKNLSLFCEFINFFRKDGPEYKINRN